MDCQGVADAQEAPANNTPLVTNPGQFVIPNFAAVAQERQLIKQDASLKTFTTQEVIAVIRTRGWSFDNPNPERYQDVPSPDNFIDILARMYLKTTKMRDKFLLNREGLKEYIFQLQNPDLLLRDPLWRFYTRSTYEYFPSPVLHPATHKTVCGLYKNLSDKEERICKAAKAYMEVPAPARRGDGPEEDRVMEEYQKIFEAQAPMTPFEETYNIMHSGHVERHDTRELDVHLGRDATYRRISGASCSITKEMIAAFIRNCPACQERTKMCSKARDKAMQNRKNKRKEEERGEPQQDEQPKTRPKLQRWETPEEQLQAQEDATPASTTTLGTPPIEWETMTIDHGGAMLDQYLYRPEGDDLHHPLGSEGQSSNPVIDQGNHMSQNISNLAENSTEMDLTATEAQEDDLYSASPPRNGGPGYFGHSQSEYYDEESIPIFGGVKSQHDARGFTLGTVEPVTTSDTDAESPTGRKDVDLTQPGVSDKHIPDGSGGFDEDFDELVDWDPPDPISQGSSDE